MEVTLYILDPISYEAKKMERKSSIIVSLIYDSNFVSTIMHIVNPENT